MNRTLIRLALLGLVAIVVPACGSKSEKAPDQPADKPAELKAIDRANEVSDEAGERAEETNEAIENEDDK